MKKTALPSLQGETVVDPAQIAAFRSNGHTLTRGVLTPAEAGAYREVINEAAYKYNTETRQLAERDTYGKAFLQIMNLWEIDENVRQFTLAQRFARIAADLLGVPSVRIYHDQALYKEPGGGFTPWHQDQYYWPLSTNNTITMWMPLIDITEEMGMLTFASGSHREGPVKNIAISDESEAALTNHIQQKGYEITRATAMNAGDATWHYGWTLHSAPGNNSATTREVMTIIYFADGAKVTEPVNSHQENDRNRWLQGLKPGEPAASRLNPLLSFLILLFFFCFGKLSAQDSTQRWSSQRAWDWYNKQPWYCGFNYIPAYAINYTAMWDKTSFDAAAIDKELALAEQSGMNVLRAVLQYAVYEEDPKYFLRTLATFTAICDKHHIKFVPSLFDDCSFGIVEDPHTGRQPAPLPGWYAWAWSPSPGHSMVVDSTTWPRLGNYVKDVIGHFKDDRRILFWDLYNEPTNGGMGSATFPLLIKVIAWARSVDPVQPLSIDVFDRNPRLNEIIFAASDIITFHNYENRDVLARQIKDLKTHGRPVICTEWMNRPWKSTVANNLEVFYQEKVGCMLWGLVNGKTQTNLPWGHRPGDPVPAVWQHDLYHGDFTPYDTTEISTLKRYLSFSR